MGRNEPQRREADMRYRLVLANPIEDPGIDRATAECIATVIDDVNYENVATKADMQEAETRLSAQVAATRTDLQSVDGWLNAQVAGVRADFTLTEHR